MQQSVPGRDEWIDHRHSRPGKAFLKVLGQKQATTRSRCGRQDDRIPYSQLMVRGEIGRPQHDFGRGLDNGKRIAPTQQGIAGVASRLPPFAYEHIEKLAKTLLRDDVRLLWKSANEVQSGVTPL